ncbi:class I SAM-dependent methyltransferase [Streptomyces sp. NPDC018693]|uniref:class I SAM-dependent methyltransferase n=1 Tax=unclassified Streptomyces TaxID=2593676 RepID=UPI003790B61B
MQGGELGQGSGASGGLAQRPAGCVLEEAHDGCRGGVPCAQFGQQYVRGGAAVGHVGYRFHAPPSADQYRLQVLLRRRLLQGHRRHLLGDSYHPGGTALTRRLADHLALTPGMRVLDVASGRGTTALPLADAYGVRAHGVDYAPVNTALAQGAAEAAGLAHRAVFTTGDAEHLPYDDGVFDAVVCECALCTFPRQRPGHRRVRPRPETRRTPRHHRRHRRTPTVSRPSCKG